MRTWVVFLSGLPLPLPLLFQLYIGSWHLKWTIQYVDPGGCIHPDRPNCVAWFHPYRSSCLFQIPRVRSPVDIKSRQMPKRSIWEDKLKSMCSTRSIKRIKSPEKKKKPSDTAPKVAPPKPSTPLNIPLSDVSPEFKRLVVSELVKAGKARVIRGKKKDMMKK